MHVPIQWTQLYMQNPIVMIFTVKFYSYKQYTNLKVCSCIIAYVYSQWWYCADICNAFLSMGGVRSRKYCASISDMTTTWTWRRLWHLSSNSSRIWRIVWLILQANGLIQYVSGRVGTVGCKVSWRGVFMVNEAVDMVGEWIWVNLCLEILNQVHTVNPLMPT